MDSLIFRVETRVKIPMAKKEYNLIVEFDKSLSAEECQEREDKIFRVFADSLFGIQQEILTPQYRRRAS